MNEYIMGMIGSQTLALPARDSTGGRPLAIIGPSTRRHPTRWFIDLPQKEDAERFPAPLGMDRSSITFSPILAYIDQPLAPGVTAVIHRIMCGSEKGDIETKPIHLWRPQPDTIAFDAMPIEGHHMSPGERLEILGNSYYWNRRGKPRKHDPKDPWDGLRAREAPRDREVHIMPLFVTFRMTWIPRAPTKRRFEMNSNHPTINRRDADPSD